MKRLLEEGIKCRKVMISAAPADIARWDRIAAQNRQRGMGAFASRSGAIRQDARSAARLRHDLRGPLAAIALASEEARLRQIDNGISAPEFLAWLDLVDRAVGEINGLLAEAGPR